MQIIEAAQKTADDSDGLEYQVAVRGLLRDSTLSIACRNQPDRDFNIAVRGTSGFFRLVSDLPGAESLSANRNSGLYLYLNGQLVGRTRRPGNLNRIWLGSSNRHYNLDVARGVSLEVRLGKNRVASTHRIEDCLTLRIAGDTPGAMIVLWLLAVLRLAAPRPPVGGDADQLAAAIKSLKLTSPWLSLADPHDG